jgi:hypothetical protein
MEKAVKSIIQEWVVKNRKIFWKYEVSSFYQTYKINIDNLPNPGEGDIFVSSHKSLLNNSQKKQLCESLKKACAKAVPLRSARVNVKVDFVDGDVVVSVVDMDAARIVY